LTSDELETAYKRLEKGAKRTRYQAIWLISCGKGLAEVAQATGYNEHYLYCLVQQYNQSGPSTLDDKLHISVFPQQILSPAQKRELRYELDSALKIGQMWKSDQVSEWIYQQTGQKVSKHCAWQIMDRLGFSPTKLKVKSQMSDISPNEK
jgi:transposase